MPGHAPYRVASAAVLRGRRVTAFCAALALGLPFAANAASPVEALSPCLMARDGIETAVTGFEAQGWTVVTEGEDYDRALNATAEVTLALNMFASEFSDEAEVQAYLDEAHVLAERLRGTTALVNGDRNLLISASGPDGPNVVQCSLVATALPDFEDALPAEPVEVGPSRMAYGFARNKSAIRPAGVAEVAVIGVRMFYPTLTDTTPLGGASVQLFVRYEEAP
ncbi:hypothetical protein [Psychromarinibacter sp. S121]|uniref:hypothetical protein n=1 Tax=Psychromarinibacter sp. S121 TaxID=3415127 RepID=UPI003C79FCE9